MLGNWKNFKLKVKSLNYESDHIIGQNKSWFSWLVLQQCRHKIVLNSCFLKRKINFVLTIRSHFQQPPVISNTWPPGNLRSHFPSSYAHICLHRIVLAARSFVFIPLQTLSLPTPLAIIIIVIIAIDIIAVILSPACPCRCSHLVCIYATAAASPPTVLWLISSTVPSSSVFLTLRFYSLVVVPSSCS